MFVKWNNGTQQFILAVAAMTWFVLQRTQSDCVDLIDTKDVN